LRKAAARTGYGLLCFLAAVTIVVAGYAYKFGGLVSQTGKGIAIGGAPSVGAMNILVMGLESRTDYEGNTLPNSLLTAMHAGNASSVSAGQVGGQDTNTLILIHIFAGGQKAVGFSIPRDDLVTYPHATYMGITRGKIDQAYDFAYNQSLGQTYGSSDSKDERYLKANQAGQQFEIATVQQVTGVHVDHFVEEWRGEPPGQGLRVERGEVRRLQACQGGHPVPPPGRGPVPRLRPGPRHASRHRPRPDETAASRPGLCGLEDGARRHVPRLRPAEQPAGHRKQVPHHRLDAQPA
jgi:LytR_cpsA_psr family